jgi:cytochrome c2
VNRELPDLTVPEYARRVAEVSNLQCSRPAGFETSDAERGREALRQYACHGCHKIPGITGPDIYVGPPLEGFASRGLIAGVLPNTHENLLLWLQSPQSIRPNSMMPDLGITDAHARDMAAYLETLK